MEKNRFQATFGSTLPTPIGASDAGGALPFVKTGLDDNPVVDIKAAAAGQLFSLHITNKTAASAAAHLLVYNAPAADVVFGTTVPTMAIPLAGDEVKELLFPVGLDLEGTGISVAASLNAVGNAGALADLIASYK